MDRRFALAAIWILALAGFVAMAALAGYHDTFPADIWLAQRFQDLHSPAIKLMLDVPEELSGTPLVVPIWIGATVLVLVAIGWRQAFLLAAALVLRFSNGQLKEIVGRPRPSLDLVSAEHQPASLSVPSGHAQSVVLLYGLLFYYATVYIKDATLRTAVQLFCGWVIIFTGMERVYVGHHWPSDVVGGFWFAGLVLALLIAIDQMAFKRRSSTLQQPNAEPLSEARSA
jgi:membrane-associated phospholipid phosphatase